MITVAEAKEFARYPHDDEDMTFSILIAAAQEYLEIATGRKFDTNPPERAKLASRMLVGHWFESREVYTPANYRALPHHLRSMIHQLRRWRDEPTEAAP